MHESGLLISKYFVVLRQIASAARLPDWLRRQIDQIGASARLHQVGSIIRLIAVVWSPGWRTVQIARLEATPDWSRVL